MRVFINNAWLDEQQAKISVFDRGFLYADAVFDTMVAYQGKIFRLEAHLQRFYNSAEYLGIQIPLERVAIAARLYESLSQNQQQDAVLRLTLSRGSGPRGVATRKCGAPNLLIYCFPGQSVAQHVIGTGVHGILAQTIRTPRSCLNPLAKTANYLNAILAMREAEQVGADQAIMLNQHGHVSEGSTSNVFWVDQGQLYTPSLDCDIMAGITRQLVIDVAKETAIPVFEGKYSKTQIRHADEIFYTNSCGPLIPLKRIDQRDLICPGPVSRFLFAQVLGKIEQETR